MARENLAHQLLAPKGAYAGRLDPAAVAKEHGNTGLRPAAEIWDAGSTVTVHYATSNGTAEAGADFGATNGMLTFVSGATNLAVEQRNVSDTTLVKLIRENILAAGQLAPYAPLEIRRADLDSEPVLGILKRLKATGKLILEGDALAHQRSLFDDNQ